MNKPNNKESRREPLIHEEEEFLGEEELDTIRLLESGLRELDSMHPVFEPKLQWIEAHLAEHETFLKKRLLRDLSLFLGTAAVVLGGLAAALLKMPNLFLGIQVAAACTAPILVLLISRKQVKDQ